MSSQKRLCTGAQEGDWQEDSDDSSEFSDDSESSSSRNALVRGDATPIKTGRQLYPNSVRNSTTKSCHSMSVNATPNAKRGGVVSHSQYDESCSQPPLGGSSDLCQLDLVAEALADANRKRNAPPSDRRRRRGIIEKRRRERINSCLNDLRSLVPAIALKQNSAKCEKAEILQLTVEYLKEVSSGQLGAKADGSGAQGAMRRSLDYRSTGFRECLTEVATYLNMQEGRPESDPLVVRLLNHLECVALQQSRADAAAVSPSSRPDANTNADTSANSTKQESVTDSRADERERPAKPKRKREQKSNVKTNASPPEIISAPTPLSSRHPVGAATPSVAPIPNNSKDNYMLPHIETTITLSGAITPCTTSAARNATANRQPPITQSGLTAGSTWHGRDHMSHPAQSVANELDTPPHPLTNHFLTHGHAQPNAQSQCLPSNYSLSQFGSSQSHTTCPSWNASPESSSFAGLPIDLLSSTNSNASFIDAGSLLPFFLGEAATPTSTGAGSNTGTNMAVPQSKDSNNNAAHAQHASATGGQTVPQPGLAAPTHVLQSFSNKTFSLPTNPNNFGVPFPVGGGSSADSVDGKSGCPEIKPSIDNKTGSQTSNQLNVPPWLNSMLAPHQPAQNPSAPSAPGGTLVELMPTPNGYYRIVGQYPVGLANAFNMPMSVPLPMSLPMPMPVLHSDVQAPNNSGNSVYLPMSVQLGAPTPGHLHAPQRQSTPPQQPPPAHSQAPPRTAQSAVLGPPSGRALGAHSQPGTQAPPQPTFMPLGPSQPQFTVGGSRLLDRSENLINAGLQQPTPSAAQNAGELGVSASGEDLFAPYGAMYHTHAHGHGHVMVNAPNTTANQQNVPNTCDSVMR